MKTSRFLQRGLAVLLISAAPAFAQMVLLSETRSVTVSYYGSGIGTETSDGNFGLFEGDAVGVPFGGGFMVARQRSNITESEISIQHYLDDYYGAGGFAVSTFQLEFKLLHHTHFNITGYCSNFSGQIGLGSTTFSVPLDWYGVEPYYNHVDFDGVLPPGTYTLSSSETPRDAVSTRFLIRASSIPDGGGSAALLLGIAILGLHAAKLRLTSGDQAYRH